MGGLGWLPLGALIGAFAVLNARDAMDRLHRTIGHLKPPAAGRPHCPPSEGASVPVGAAAAEQLAPPPGYPWFQRATATDGDVALEAIHGPRYYTLKRYEDGAMYHWDAQGRRTAFHLPIPDGDDEAIWEDLDLP